MHNIFSVSIHFDWLPRYSFFRHKMATILFSLCMIVFNYTLQLWEPVSAVQNCVQLWPLLALCAIAQSWTLSTFVRACGLSLQCTQVKVHQAFRSDVRFVSKLWSNIFLLICWNKGDHTSWDIAPLFAFFRLIFYGSNLLLLLWSLRKFQPR